LNQCAARKSRNLKGWLNYLNLVLLFIIISRDQEEIRKAKDIRRRLREKSKAQAQKNEEKLLAKKTYTYTYSGEIIFVKKSDSDRLPNTLSLVIITIIFRI